MRQQKPSILTCALALAVAACQPAAVEEAPVAEAAPAAELGVMMLPVTTESEEAKGHFATGLAAADAGRFLGP